jgi:hypothetical protein
MSYANYLGAKGSNPRGHETSRAAGMGYQRTRRGGGRTTWRVSVLWSWDSPLRRAPGLTGPPPPLQRLPPEAGLAPGSGTRGSGPPGRECGTFVLAWGRGTKKPAARVHDSRCTELAEVLRHGGGLRREKVSHWSMTRYGGTAGILRQTGVTHPAPQNTTNSSRKQQ